VNKNICYIVGAGTNYGLDFIPQDGDYVIAADGGFDYLHKQGITVDLSIGDFDSVLKKPTHGNIITLNKDKDYTDAYEAVQKGIAKGYRIFHIYCGTGGRPDHTLANIQLLGFLAQNGKRGYLVDEKYVITAIASNKVVSCTNYSLRKDESPDSSISFAPGCKGNISVFSYSDVSDGVSIKGLKYELENHNLSNTSPIGVSNEFTGAGSLISVSNGTLVITFPRECMGFEK